MREAPGNYSLSPFVDDKHFPSPSHSLPWPSLVVAVYIYIHIQRENIHW
jgi:hypothetical protein